jgi:hypothetical protein
VEYWDKGFLLDAVCNWSGCDTSSCNEGFFFFVTVCQQGGSTQDGRLDFGLSKGRGELCGFVGGQQTRNGSHADNAVRFTFDLQQFRGLVVGQCQRGSSCIICIAIGV